MFGTELDLGSVAFVNQLNVDLNNPQENNGMQMYILRTSNSGCAYEKSVQAPAFETIDVLTLLSGIAASVLKEVCKQVVCSASTEFRTIGQLVGTSAIKDHGLICNLKGGVLPAIEEYSGSSNPSQFGLWRSLGAKYRSIPVLTGGARGAMQAPKALRRTTLYTTRCHSRCYMSADGPQPRFIRCHLDDDAGSVYSFFTWSATANCSGNSSSQTYFTIGNAVGQMDPASEGFLPVVVVPYLTTVNVTYNEGIISVDRIGTSSDLTDSPSSPLSQYIATVMNYQASINQGLKHNLIGDFLTAYGNNNVTDMYSELEDYWRGIAEFASTQLRSGYSATADIPSSMTRSTSGTMYIMTYGWRSRSLTYIFLLAVITVSGEPLCWQPGTASYRKDTIL
ncbi:hypothetical protein DFH29DRAFT_1043872 [Suillus ampliporus]|nr:hypothetical protein DFH29DRAFT_1043872 [Suillus ampliporus]